MIQRVTRAAFEGTVLHLSSTCPAHAQHAKHTAEATRMPAGAVAAATPPLRTPGERPRNNGTRDLWEDVLATHAESVH